MFFLLENGSKTKYNSVFVIFLLDLLILLGCSAYEFKDNNKKIN